MSVQLPQIFFFYFFITAPKVEENVNNENIPPQEMKAVSIPQPAQS
jgi:hypothetical protein